MITNAYKYANGDTKSTIDIAIFIIPINTPHALPTLTPNERASIPEISISNASINARISIVTIEGEKNNIRATIT